METYILAIDEEEGMDKANRFNTWRSLFEQAAAVGVVCVLPIRKFKFWKQQ